MALLAELHDNGRATERHPLDADATLRTMQQEPVDVLIVNLSAKGCLFLCGTPLEVGATVSIGITGVGRRNLRIVRVVEERHGAEFVPPLTADDLAAVLDAPSSTIVSFPGWTAGTTPVAEQAPPGIAKLAGPARLTIVAALVAATWGGVVAARILLF